MPLSKEDYYKVLQVDSAADPDIIAVAYKRLALKYHPDTNPSPDATRRMQAINTAGLVLFLLSPLAVRLVLLLGESPLLLVCVVGVLWIMRQSYVRALVQLNGGIFLFYNKSLGDL